MKKLLPLLLLLLIALWMVPVPAALAQTAEQAIVQVILFYSPSCPHCHYIIDEILPPLQETYGDRLQILGINTTEESGAQLYRAAVEQFGIPSERIGVPTLIIGEVVLVGSQEIPEQLPDLIEEGMAAGGTGWPAIPGLELVFPDLPPSADPAAAPEEAPTPAVTAQDPAAVETVPDSLSAEQTRPPADSVGFALAWVVMGGAAVALFYTFWQLLQIPSHQLSTAELATKRPQTWAIPLLLLVGLVVAGYLSYVEVNQVEAVCGPVGECNIVQSSPYARIMGIPVAILGILSYLAIGALWLGQRLVDGRFRHLITLALLVLTIAGTIFSMYLTALELLVIGAVCAWCLTSAVVTTLLMVLVAEAVERRPLQMEWSV